MSYLLAGLAIVFMIIGYAFRKSPAMLAATIAWMIFSIYIASLDMDTTVQMGITSLGGILALYTAIQSLYLMGVLSRQAREPEDEAREQMEHVRKQVALRRMSRTRSGELNDFDRLVRRSNVRIAKERMKEKGYRLG